MSSKINRKSTAKSTTKNPRPSTGRALTHQLAFRLSAEAAEKLDRLTALYNVSSAEVLRRLIILADAELKK